LYFLFTCPYEKLYLRPEPNTQQERNELWNWDVAEVFLGSDFRDIKRYKEFEVSPQGEWIDLDVDLHKRHHEDSWTWNSGVEVAVRTDAPSHRWYAAMRIPYSAVDTRAAALGNILRINLFRTQGAARASPRSDLATPDEQYVPRSRTIWPAEAGARSTMTYRRLGAALSSGAQLHA
jgi:hypothetical protein